MIDMKVTVTAGLVGMAINAWVVAIRNAEFWFPSMVLMGCGFFWAYIAIEYWKNGDGE